jgi:hypothetical protein
MKRRGKKAVRKSTRASYDHEDKKSREIKRVFYIFLDIITLMSFSLSLYSICVKDYTKTILYLAIGTLLLIFFIIKKAFKTISKKN